jgi:long-subunit acyl-CoA synthetase (AMP-forming)
MEGAVTTRPPSTPPRALTASTMCEAFQITAAEHPEQVALRTIGGGTSITFAEYASRVRRLAAGLHALGVRGGDTVGLLLTNRPEFHLVDTAAMHLGARPFSIYNTS